MDFAAVFLLQVATAVASLILISLGLAVIFGMMRVINLAHGEFLMLGGYTVITASHHGINLWLSMFVVAPLTAGIIGVAIERLVVRHLYGRILDTLLATWGISLALVGAVTVVFGNTTEGISAPLGSVEIGAYRTSLYEIFLVPVACVMVFIFWLVLRWTRLGLIARGTMQNPDMAASLGVNPSLVYAVTFGVGSAVSGLAGALLAPLTGVVPTMGTAYIAKAFITVIGGGSAAILTGTVAASSALASLDIVVTFLTNPVIGEVALLSAAVVLLRVLPHGITGRLFRGAL